VVAISPATRHAAPDLAMGIPAPTPVANVRFAAGGFQLGIGLVLLSLGRQAGTDAERRKMYRLSAWFLVPAVGNFLGGYWYTNIARSAPPRT